VTPPQRSILLDAEAMSALAANAKSMQPWAVYARTVGASLYVSAATLAEVSGEHRRDVALYRALKIVVICPVTKEIGLRAGVLRSKVATARRKPRDLTIDSIVAATALTLPSPTVVLTSDEPDFRLLLAGTHISVAGLG